MIKKILLGIAVAGLLVMASGCGVVMSNGDMKSTKIHVDKDNAKSLDLTLNMGAGELTLEKGGKEWIEGTVDSNDSQLKPTVSYKLKNGEGFAVIENKKKIGNLQLDEVKNEWMLKLSDSIPVKLTVNSGASKTTMDLKGLYLSGLDVNSGVGDMTIDLSGDWQNSFDAKIKMGVGKSTIILPNDVGVRINSTKGIGKEEFVGFISKGNGVYVNEAFENGDGDTVIDIETELGIGKAIFKLDN